MISNRGLRLSSGDTTSFLTGQQYIQFALWKKKIRIRIGYIADIVIGTVSFGVDGIRLCR